MLFVAEKHHFLQQRPFFFEKIPKEWKQKNEPSDNHCSGDFITSPHLDPIASGLSLILTNPKHKSKKKR